ncbi:hypothetical protein IWQ60_008732 [Tieghemiomyces parasiticus]|uniref:DUF7886 domain-containing protein n=1 Tax=Tieghemiomyces parasiticus TaxID=78921 RepID=A0A9W7ZWI0_9FUNG|nr:hypothetical protein IWQ60_008732 [Tieghemiomyces parasiticus]
MQSFTWSRRTKAETEAARLSEFLQDLMVVGSLKGFKYLELSVRGREELLLRVRNDYPDLAAPTPKVPPNSLLVLRSANPAATNLPLIPVHPVYYVVRSQARNRALTSIRTQTILQEPPPPFEPPKSCIDRDLERDDRYTSFLIAAYGRYRCPYVWLRSHHERLIRIKENQKLETDNPLKLESTSCWKQFDIRPWDIIVEVVCLTLRPQPENPFAIDHAYFDHLPLEEAVVRTGAMVKFLQRMSVRHYYFSETHLVEDLEKLQLKHYDAFCELMAARRNLGAPPFS